ncbi:hypothetical protein J132_00142 [Termitomyces sp. J132]|nr:hypothetical protein J132_00142 [Termitomyces sp. J132]
MSTIVTEGILPRGSDMSLQDIMWVTFAFTGIFDTDVKRRTLINHYNEETSDEVHPLVLDTVVQIVLSIEKTGSGSVSSDLPKDSPVSTPPDVPSEKSPAIVISASPASLPATFDSLPTLSPLPPPVHPQATSDPFQMQARMANPYWHLTQLMPAESSAWLARPTYNDFWSTFRRNNDRDDEGPKLMPSVVPGWPTTPPPSFPEPNIMTCIVPSPPDWAKRKVDIL